MAEAVCISLQRFTTARHYYGCNYTQRNLLLAWVPAVLSNAFDTQMIVLVFAISILAFIQCLLLLWRSTLANAVDLIISTELLLVIMCGGLLLAETLDPAHSQIVVQHFLFVILSTSFGIAALAIMFAIYRILSPLERYGIFFCHHKGGAAVLARYFKESLRDQVVKRVFLDSDELDALDLIFGTVAGDT